uniref:Uncharacterized protein n=1 Tax=Timema poppense TaxID=170557 RepID=A0A7R9GVB8_TIMPO|nr:unnamed protein product [Timema poppensis]
MLSPTRQTFTVGNLKSPTLSMEVSWKGMNFTSTVVNRPRNQQVIDTVSMGHSTIEVEEFFWCGNIGRIPRVLIRLVPVHLLAKHEEILLMCDASYVIQGTLYLHTDLFQLLCPSRYSPPVTNSSWPVQHNNSKALQPMDSAVGQRGLKQRQGKANNLQAESNKSKPQDVSSKPKEESEESDHDDTTSNAEETQEEQIEESNEDIDEQSTSSKQEKRSEKGYKISDPRIHVMAFYHIASLKKEPLLPYSIKEPVDMAYWALFSPPHCQGESFPISYGKFQFNVLGQVVRLRCRAHEHKPDRHTYPRVEHQKARVEIFLGLTQIPSKLAIRRLSHLFFTERDNRIGILYLPTVWSVSRQHREVQWCGGAGLRVKCSVGRTMKVASPSNGTVPAPQNIRGEFLSLMAGPRPHGPDMERNCYESLLIVLDTLERCLSNQPKDTAKFDEAMNVKLLLREICQFIDVPNDNPTVLQLKNLASKVLFALSLNFFNAVFNRISARLQELSACNEENPDYSDIELIQHINVDVLRLTKLLSETIQKFRLLKKSAHIVLMTSLEKAVWNWMDTYPHEFADIQCYWLVRVFVVGVKMVAIHWLSECSCDEAKVFSNVVAALKQKKPNEELSKCCEGLFDILDTFADNKKGRAAVWPLQIMLLVLSPKVLEEIVNADSGAPCSPRHSKKKQFIDSVKRAVGPHSTSKQLTEASAVTCVKLCKASTYINILDSNNVAFTLVQSVINDLKCVILSMVAVYPTPQTSWSSCSLIRDDAGVLPSTLGCSKLALM